MKGAGRRRALGVPLLLGAAVGAASTRLAIVDGDVFWHLATARLALEHGLVRADAFSWTVPGSPVPVDQWLGQILWYAAYAAGEWRGVVGLRALAVAALVALTAWAALSRRLERPVVAVIAAAPTVFLSRFVWNERPELFGFVCFAACVALLGAWRTGGPRVPVALAALLLVWANLHGSFALGSVLVALFAADRALRGSWRRSDAAALAGVAASFLATPSGILTARGPALHLLSPPRFIQEWALPDVSTLPGATWAVLVCLLLLVALLAPPVSRHDAIVILPVAFLSLVAIRHAPLLAIAAAPYLAARLPEAADAVRARLGLPAPPALPPARPGGRRADAAIALASVALIAVGAATAPPTPDEARFPAGALAALPPGPGLFNHYDWGGWLIWRAPRTPVFVDGRLTPYLGPTLDDYRRVIAAGPGWRETLERRGVRTLLVRPDDPLAVRAIDLGWRVLAAEDDFVLIEVGRP